MTSIVSKPWGSFQVIEEGEKYMVKKIIVKPKGKVKKYLILSKKLGRLIRYLIFGKPLLQILIL